jgi:guanylate cyclase
MSPSSTSSRFFNRLLSVGADPADPSDLRQRKRLFVGAAWGGVLVNSFLPMVLVALGTPLVAIPLTLICFALLCVLVSLHLRPALFPVCVHTGCLLVILSPLSVTLLFGGLSASGGGLMWGFLAPICAMTMLGQRAGKFWLVAFFISIVVGAVVPNWIPVYSVMPAPSAVMVSNFSMVGLFIFLALRYFIRQRDEFQRKSDDLLRNILPDEIAERLKDSSTFIAEHFDHASVLFADVVGFTPMSSQMSPTELVALLNEVFSEFDQLVKRHNVEKIKTIGDCYMVAAGVPQPRADHATALTQLALEMQALMASRDFHGHPLRFRIGLNSGPLVAGVIGRHKFIYDLWGDAVNTASRMESHGAGGSIQITEATYELIKGNFICEAHGTINVKGKGEMKVWYVLDKKA